MSKRKPRRKAPTYNDQSLPSRVPRLTVIDVRDDAPLLLGHAQRNAEIMATMTSHHEQGAFVRDLFERVHLGYGAWPVEEGMYRFGLIKGSLPEIHRAMEEGEMLGAAACIFVESEDHYDDLRETWDIYVGMQPLSRCVPVRMFDQMMPAFRATVVEAVEEMLAAFRAPPTA